MNIANREGSACHGIRTGLAKEGGQMDHGRMAQEVVGAKAEVRTQRTLWYTSAVKGGPEYARSASGIAAWAEGWAVVQDDANFLAWVSGTEVRSLSLPLRNGHSLFGATTGGKLNKFDLEAVANIAGGLVLFGSGSTSNREVVLSVEGDPSGFSARECSAAEWYLQLRTAIGSELNIEGVCIWRDQLWLAHRGNGAGRHTDVLFCVDSRSFYRWLGGGPLPDLLRCLPVNLGNIDGVRLTITDLHGGDLLYFVAAAEDSPDAILDGPLVGAAIGAFDGENVRWVRIFEAGGPSVNKFEGIAQDNEDPHRFWLVNDADDPAVPSSLFLLEVSGLKEAFQELRSVE